VAIFQAFHRAHQLVLDVERQAGRDAVGVILVRRQAFGLEKNLVTVFVSKAVDLVFHARAITRAHALDLAGEHGAAVKARADDLVRALVGVGDPARHLLWVHVGLAHEAEHRHPALRVHAAGHTIARLLRALGKVDGAAIQTRRCAGFQTPLRQLQFFQARRQADSRGIARTTGRIVLQTHMDFAVEEGSRRQHHRARTEADAHLRDSTHHTVTFDHQIVYRLLKKPQVGLVLEHAADGGFVQNAVGLGAGGAHGRAFGAVEDAELDAAFVGGQRHGPAQCIDLFDQVAFANTANRRVATHLAQRLDVVRQKQSFAAHAGRGQGRFGSGMAATDHNHIEFLRV
jgi:hypothetical protein